MLYRIQVHRVLYVVAEDEHEAETLARSHAQYEDPARADVDVETAYAQQVVFDGWAGRTPYGAGAVPIGRDGDYDVTRGQA